MDFIIEMKKTIGYSGTKENVPNNNHVRILVGKLFCILGFNNCHFIISYYVNNIFK